MTLTSPSNKAALRISKWILYTQSLSKPFYISVLLWQQNNEKESLDLAAITCYMYFSRVS